MVAALKSTTYARLNRRINLSSRRKNKKLFVDVKGEFMLPSSISFIK